MVMTLYKLTNVTHNRGTHIRVTTSDAPTSNQYPCDIPGSCKIKGSQNYGRITILETPQDSYRENILDSIKTKAELQYELSVVESDYNFVRINKIIILDNIQQIIDELNKTSIIGEDPTKYWKKDPVICKLEIINPDLIIKTKDI